MLIFISEYRRCLSNFNSTHLKCDLSLGPTTIAVCPAQP
nr:MAG TPA: hypothetical protein [Caudoviricetes sp.]